LLKLVTGYVERCKEGGLVMLADLEGNMLGFGGTATTAALQVTRSVCAETLVPRPPPVDRPQDPGLLLDLSYAPCVLLLKLIMESPDIKKFLWGALEDCKAMLHQSMPVPLDIHPVALVDAQLAFSTAQHRMGMSSMLEQVPQSILRGLPKKEQIDWDRSFAQNLPVWNPPFSQKLARYAVDDLHRLEAVLRSMVPRPRGSYVIAKYETADQLKKLKKDNLGINDLLQYFEKLPYLAGDKRLARAVKVVRHLHSLTEMDAILNQSQQSTVDLVAQRAHEILQRAGVDVAADLSFNKRNDQLEFDAADDNEHASDEVAENDEVGYDVAAWLPLWTP